MNESEEWIMIGIFIGLTILIIAALMISGF
jgi:hypothetical protein